MDDKSMPEGISRRSVVLNSLVCATGLAATLAASTNAAMAAKLPKTAVNYKTSPNGDKKCSTCALFEPPNACKNVAGDIDPNGWCVLWRTK